MIVLSMILYMADEFDFAQLQGALFAYSSMGLILVVASIVISDLLFSLRWTLISERKHKLIPAFESTTVATFLGFFLPAKLGEVSKLVYLKKCYGYKIYNSLSYLFSEKILDIFVFSLAIIGTTTFLIESQKAAIAGYLMIFFTAAFVLILRLFPLRKLIDKLPYRLTKIYLRKIVSKLERLLRMKQIKFALLLTLLVWLTNYITSYFLFFHAAGFEISAREVLVVYLLSTMAFAISVTPGGVGVYEASIVLGLGWYGIEKEDALLAALMLRVLHVATVGLLIFYIANKHAMSFHVLTNLGKGKI